MKVILNVMFADPANFPPTINACRVQRQAGYDVHLSGFYRGIHRCFVAGAGITEHYSNDMPGGWPQGLTSKMRYLANFRASLNHLISQIRPDIIIAYDYHGLWGVIPHLKCFPVLCHVHDLWDRKVGYLDRMIIRNAYKSIVNTAAVIMPQEHRITLARSEMELPQEVFCVPNCSMLSRCYRSTILSELIEQRIGSKPEALIVRAAGEGPTHMIEPSLLSLKHLPSSHHLCLIGCGNEAYGRQMRDKAIREGVESRLHQFAYLNYDDMRAYLRSAHVGLALYRRDDPDVNKRYQATASDKFMEYLAAGLPIIVNDLPDFRALIEKTGAAIAIKEETPEAIAEAILKATEDPITYNRLSREASQAHEREFYYERQYEPVLGFISSIL